MVLSPCREWNGLTFSCRFCDKRKKNRPKGTRSKVVCVSLSCQFVRSSFVRSRRARAQGTCKANQFKQLKIAGGLGTLDVLVQDLGGKLPKTWAKYENQFYQSSKDKKFRECFLNCVTQRCYARNVLIINALRS
jgi:hypothetical protein